MAAGSQLRLLRSQPWRLKLFLTLASLAWQVGWLRLLHCLHGTMRDELAAAAPPLPPAASPSPPRTRRPYLPRLPRLPYRPTLLGRSVLLLTGGLGANVVLWIAAACTFATSETHKGVLSLCVVAWTLGLRHGLGEYRCLVCTGCRKGRSIAAELASSSPLLSTSNRRYGPHHRDRQWCAHSSPFASLC